jgi:hypothetical protein
LLSDGDRRFQRAPEFDVEIEITDDLVVMVIFLFLRSLWATIISHSCVADANAA